MLLRMPSVRVTLHLGDMHYPKGFRKRVRHGNSNCQSINKGKPKGIGTLFFVASLSSIWFPYVFYMFECQALVSPTSVVDTDTTREPSETAAATTLSTSPVDPDVAFSMGAMQLQPLELFPETQMYGDSLGLNPELSSTCLSTPGVQAFWQNVNQGDSQWVPDDALQQFLHDQCVPSFCPQPPQPPQQREILEICSDDEPSMPPPSLPLNMGFDTVASLNLFFSISVNTNAL